MTPKFTLVLDSSQIANYLECAELWNNQYRKRLVPASRPLESDAMNAGTYGHKLLDIFYRNCHLPLNDRLALAFDYDPDNDICECGCNKEFHQRIEVLRITECKRCKNCLGGFKAKPFSLPQEARFAVRNRLRDYAFYYQQSDFQPLSPEHVEVGFSEPLYEDSQNLFVLEGRIDLIATLQGMRCIADHKFQLREHLLYGRSIQFKNYALVTKSLMMIINYVRLHQKVSKTTLVRDVISFTAPELLAWKQRLIGIFFQVKHSLEAETFQQNWGACQGRYNSICPYTLLCEEINSDMKQIKEQQLYRINDKEWKPW